MAIELVKLAPSTSPSRRVTDDSRRDLSADAPTDVEVTATGGLGHALRRLGQVQLFASKNASAEDVIFFTQQLALLLDTGNSLVPAISALAKQAGSPALQKVLAQVTLDLESGADFSGALRQHPEVFDGFFISLIRAGEASGALSESLKRIKGILDVKRSLRTQIKEAMAYPVVLMCVMGVTLVFMFAFIIPKFDAIFDGMHDILPASTRLLLGTSDLIRNHWQIVLPAAVAFAIGLRMLTKLPQVRGIWDRIKPRLPVAGTLTSLGHLHQLFSSFGLLLGSRVPLLETIGIVREAIRSAQYEAFFSRLSRNVEAGEGLAKTFQEARFLPETVKLMVATGEQAGALDTVMVQLSEYYRQELEAQIRRLSVTLEPVMLVVMGTMVGFIAVSFIVPIFKMSQTMH